MKSPGFNAANAGSLKRGSLGFFWKKTCWPIFVQDNGKVSTISQFLNKLVMKVYWLHSNVYTDFNTLCINIWASLKERKKFTLQFTICQTFDIFDHFATNWKFDIYICFIGTRNQSIHTFTDRCHSSTATNFYILN